MGLEAVSARGTAAVVVHGDRQEVILQVRVLDTGAAADEAARLEVAGGAQALAEEHPVDADLQLVPGLERRVERHRLLAGVLDVDLQVVLQVLADARAVGRHRDAMGAQVVGRADAREQEQLRRIDRTACQDHFPLGAGPGLGTASPVGDAGRAAVHEIDPADQRAVDDREVGPLYRRAQVTLGRRPAFAGPAGAVHARQAFLLMAVHVLGHRIAGLPPGLDPGRIERMIETAGGHVQRTLAAVVGVRALFVGLRLAEVRQQVAIVPAGQALLGPAVVVARVAAHVGHAVDRARSADHAAARLIDRAAVHEGLGLRAVGPVVALALQRFGQSRRHMDHPGHQAAVGTAGLQQQDGDLGVFAQPGGQHAAGRTGADDDVVVGLLGHLGLLASPGSGGVGPVRGRVGKGLGQ